MNLNRSYGQLTHQPSGCNAASMKLSIEDLKGKKIGEIDDEERLLGSYPIDDGMSIRVTDPEAIDWNNLDRVEKQEMDEDTYDTFKPTSVKPTVREYKVKFTVNWIDDLYFFLAHS